MSDVWKLIYEGGASLSNFFRCYKCGRWYHHNDKGPFMEHCQHCYWGIAPDRKSMVTRKQMAVLMAGELLTLMERRQLSDDKRLPIYVIDIDRPNSGNTFIARL